MKKTVKIGDKYFELNEVDAPAEGGEATPVAPVEAPAPVAPAPEAPVAPAPENIEAKVDKAVEEVIARLGLGDLGKKLDAALSQKEAKPTKKASDLLDLEALMQKDVSEMTTKEKIVGFFQAMLQNNHTVMKALSEGGSGADGGYLFPDEFRAEIIRDMAESPRMRNEVTVIPMRRDVLNMPSLASRPKVTWTDENAVKSTTTAHFGQITLTVKKMAAILYASDELIDDSTEVDIVNFIIGLFSEAIGEEEDRVIWRGNGTTEPTGIHGNSGIATISGATGLSVDKLIDLVHALPQKYHSNAKLYTHRSNIREMRKLKDENGRYYWVDPVTASSMPSFMGYPVMEVNELPESAIYFGDLKKAYWLGDRQRMTVKVSQETETAFTKDQTAIRVVSRIAGNVVLGAAAKGLVSLP